MKFTSASYGTSSSPTVDRNSPLGKEGWNIKEALPTEGRNQVYGSFVMIVRITTYVATVINQCEIGNDFAITLSIGILQGVKQRCYLTVKENWIGRN